MALVIVSMRHIAAHTAFNPSSCTNPIGMVITQSVIASETGSKSDR